MNESENTYYLKHKNDPEFRERRREASRLYKARRRAKERGERLPLPSIVCPICGKTFTPATRRQQFCSDHCAHNGARLRRSGGPWIRTCKACGRVFKTTKKQKVYCSVGCQQECHKRQLLAKYHARRAQERPATAAPLDVVNPMLTAKTRQEEAQILAGYERDMKVALWFAYLPDAERAANINTLTKRQRSMAERVWRERHYGAHGANESDCGRRI